MFAPNFYSPAAMPATYRTLAPVLLLCLFAATACNRSDARTQTAPHAAEATAHTNFLEDAQALKAAQTALADLPPFRGKTPMFYENIDFFSGVRPRIEIDLQNPARPERIDHYRYENGRWHYTDTPRLEPGTDIPAKLTPLATVNFADAAAIAARWSQKARTVDAVITEPYYISFVLLEKDRKRFWHTATIEAVGRQYYFSCHADGTVWEFKELSK